MTIDRRELSMSQSMPHEKFIDLKCQGYVPGGKDTCTDLEKRNRIHDLVSKWSEWTGDRKWSRTNESKEVHL